MELLPNRRPRLRRTVDATGPTFRRALRLAVFCIAAFECSQFVFQAGGRSSWSDADAQLARADVVPVPDATDRPAMV